MSVFVIQNVKSGLVLDGADIGRSGKVILFESHGGDNQKWAYRDAMIFSKANGTDDRYVDMLF